MEPAEPASDQSSGDSSRTSTCWSSAPASPASTSSTAPAKPASPRSCSRPAAAWAAPGTGTATPGRGSTRRATPTPTCSRGALRRVGVAGALRGPAGDRALPQPRGRPVRPPAPHPLRARRSPRPSYDESSGRWTVTTSDGTRFRTRFLVAATGVLSVPYFPDVPGREDFRGESYHTGLWPTTPVDFAGKRVAVIGTGSSGVQLIPAIADEVASLTVYQRTANWCTPLNNAPITPDEQAQLRADFEAIARDAEHVAERLPPPRARPGHLRRLERGAAGVLREDVEQPRLLEAHQPLHRPAVRSRRQRRVVRVHRREDPRASSTTPRPPSKLIPKDHRFAREAAALRHRLLRGLQPAERLARRPQADADRAHDRRRDRDGRRRAGVRHHRVGDRLRLRHRRAPAMGIRGRRRSRPRGPLGRWSEDVPRRSRPTGFPNFFFPGGPHAAAGNNPRYNGDQVDFITDDPGLPPRPRLRHHRGRPGRRGASGRAWSTAARHATLRGEQLLLRHQHPGQAAQVPPELGRPARSSSRRSPRSCENDYKAFSCGRRTRHAADARHVRPSRPASPASPRAGQPQRRRGEQEPAPVVLAQPGRQLVQVPHLPERDAEPEQAEVVDRQERVPALVAVPADQPLDRVVVGHQRRDLRVGDPLQQRRRPGRRGTCTSCGSSPDPGRGSTSSTFVANPVWSRSMSPGSTTTLSAAMISSSVFQVDRRASRGPRWWARSTRTPRPCTPWKAMCSRPRWCAKQRWLPPSPRCVGLRSDQVDRRRGTRCSRRPPRPRRRRRRTRRRRGRASPTASSTAARGSPRRRPTRRRTGGCPSRPSRSCGRCRRWPALPCMSSVGARTGGYRRWFRAVPPGIVERQAQAEADAGLDLAHALEDLLGGEQVDAAELVVVAPVAPGRAGRALLSTASSPSSSFWPVGHVSRPPVSVACTDRLV